MDHNYLQKTSFRAFAGTYNYLHSNGPFTRPTLDRRRLADAFFMQQLIQFHDDCQMASSKRK